MSDKEMSTDASSKNCFEGKTEAEAREEILALVSDYAKAFHTKKPYETGDRIPYAAPK